VLSAPLGDVYAQLVLGTAPANLIAYWPLSDASGTTVADLSGNGRTGTYAGGPTLGQPGIGDGRTCAYFAGDDERADVFSASLAAAFSFTEFSASLWCRMYASSVWTDGSARKALLIQSNGNPDFFLMRKSSTNNKLGFWLRMNSNDYSTEVSVGESLGAEWFHIGFTSLAGGNAYRYINGVEATHRSAVAAANGAARTVATISEFGETWYGCIAHVALWSKQLTAVQMAALASPP
jgi:hypothetical protein